MFEGGEQGVPGAVVTEEEEKEACFFFFCRQASTAVHGAHIYLLRTIEMQQRLLSAAVLWGSRGGTAR